MLTLPHHVLRTANALCIVSVYLTCVSFLLFGLRIVCIVHLLLYRTASVAIDAVVIYSARKFLMCSDNRII